MTTNKQCPACHENLEHDLPFCIYCGVSLPEEEPTSSLLGAIVDGRYRLSALVGRGGMGEVYRAQRLPHGDDVAFKVLLAHPLDNPVHLRRFLDEIRALAKVQHDNLVRVIDTGVMPPGDDRPYYVMPFLAGQTLGATLEKGPLLVSAGIAIIIQILAALQALHDAALVHRDVKAENVILDPSGHATLLDLGIARVIKSTQGATMAGEIVGTLEVMAPEQILGRPVDARTDVYQAGALLLHLLLGRPAFAAQSTTSWYSAHLHNMPLGFDHGGIPQDVARICLKALEKEPNDRFSSAADMATAIRQAQAKWQHT